jgi:hypothetical protein
MTNYEEQIHALFKPTVIPPGGLITVTNSLSLEQRVISIMRAAVQEAYGSATITELCNALIDRLEKQ